VTYRLLQDNRQLRNKVERIARGRALPTSSRDNCLVTNTCDDNKNADCSPLVQLLYDRMFIGGSFSAAVDKSGYTTENDKTINLL